jgi:Domain of unknown function (DUF4159)
MGSLRRACLVGGLALVAGVSMLAQRGGFGGGGGNRFTGLNANVPYDGKFVFVRMSYDGGFGGRQGPMWSHDYPTGEGHFMRILTTVSDVPAHIDGSSVLAFDDPEIFKFPVIYLVEPGTWSMTDNQVKALRAYLLKGGFLIVDDMGGGTVGAGGRFRPDQWPNLDLQMSRVFPEGRWQDIEAEHPVFHAFFEIPVPHDIPQYYDGGKPIFRGMYENNDPSKRLMVFVNYNTDISEFWEFSETGMKPISESNEAYKIGVNEFIYGITH